MAKKEHRIDLSILLNARLGITTVIINNNTTHLPSNSKLVESLSRALLEGLKENRDDLNVQDLLNDTIKK